MNIFRYIRELSLLIDEADSIVAFTGAGISTPSGIPDFRSPDSGIWNNIDPMDLASLQGFRRNPQAFYDWFRPLAELAHLARPNPAHMALTTLQRLGKLDAVITQNIDSLHHRAGNRNVLELHGQARTATCIDCFCTVEADSILHTDTSVSHTSIPRCRDCGGVLKPDVILFGEQLPYQALQAARDVAQQADLMLMLGSSLEVYPAADIPRLTLDNGGRVVIVNFDATELDSLATLVIRCDVAEVLPLAVKQVEKHLTPRRSSTA